MFNLSFHTPLQLHKDLRLLIFLSFLSRMCAYEARPVESQNWAQIICIQMTNSSEMIGINMDVVKRKRAESFAHLLDMDTALP